MTLASRWIFHSPPIRMTRFRAFRTARSNSAMTTCRPLWSGPPSGFGKPRTGWASPVDVIAVHLDYDDTDGAPYFNLKLLCNEEDLAGAPIALRKLQSRSAS